MGQQFKGLAERHIRFIEAQKLFFVATATADSRVNLSPKGMDSLRVLGANRVAWLNVTGSGNETAAHLQSHPRMTLMFCAFEGSPMILRLYGQARAIHLQDPQWPLLEPLFPALPGARQIFDMEIDMVQSSCGMSVPFFDYVGERDQLNQWAEKKGPDGIRKYWHERNQQSIDGIATGIADKNG
ncbi:pyridoxamine 5'-phosphate oxidase [Pokkaliibacter plantistimulans]|uniref:Pyridoxamine 5'-phosphate oxidase n=1 Tax=Pokkaliibacter plantistimulans TaxID=1635171 RepID=A0ABX5LV46_9GAMM|nr:pyridoxamine 5'-phosphate oxidase family protein [Pokkaliibacter plantistimulans]PXF30547.1 pyridoxamine 5'-phosphate oxidase [Pokkaliibacter plantistimulans]